MCFVYEALFDASGISEHNTCAIPSHQALPSAAFLLFQ